MYFLRSNLTTGNHLAVGNTIWNDVDPTDLTVKPERFQWESWIDIIYYDTNYSTTCGYDWHPGDPSDPDTSFVIGMAACSRLSGNKCDSFVVRFDTSYTNTASANHLRTLACHETGHTLGLKHRAGGCMPATVPLNAHFFTSHDVGELNDNYQ